MWEAQTDLCMHFDVEGLCPPFIFGRVGFHGRLSLRMPICKVADEDLRRRINQDSEQILCSHEAVGNRPCRLWLPLCPEKIPKLQTLPYWGWNDPETHSLQFQSPLHDFLDVTLIFGEFLVLFAGLFAGDK
jgi:hypothetical protein